MICNEYRVVLFNIRCDNRTESCDMAIRSVIQNLIFPYSLSLITSTSFGFLCNIRSRRISADDILNVALSDTNSSQAYTSFYVFCNTMQRSKTHNSFRKSYTRYEMFKTMIMQIANALHQTNTQRKQARAICLLSRLRHLNRAFKFKYAYPIIFVMHATGRTL